ncbi:MAG: hypothetical protein JSS66_09970 [Armatimonadetes bacterium]|nr:hypothetical protein [Armatimonadota bacterium]
MRTTSVVLISGVVGVLAGCVTKGIQTRFDGREDPPSKGDQAVAVYKTPSELAPDALPYSKVRINVAGTEVPAELKRKASGKEVVFEIVAKGETLEEEHYVSTPGVFSFVSLGGSESYDPPIPLVRYPFKVVDSWDWTGTASLGTLAKPATAKITAAPEVLNLATGVSDCVLVTASLVVETGGGGESKRNLKFWIEPKRGVVKRDFGSSTSREPRPLDSEP